MNVCERYKCNTCETIIDCRIGISNRPVQPFQFACPKCEERISFTFGTGTGELEGATRIVKLTTPFGQDNPFVDLHLDFPVKFGHYQKGDTAFMRATTDLDLESFKHLGSRLSLLDELWPKTRELKRLITQYKRSDWDSFERICHQIPGVNLRSRNSADLLAAIYTATSVMSSPFTIHEHNAELSEQSPRLLIGLHNTHQDKLVSFLNTITDNQFLKNLHYDCLSLYPRILSLELPIRPTLYYDYIEADVGMTPSRVSNADFETCNNFYKDLAEVFSRQLVILAAVNNLYKRGDADTFSDSFRLNKKLQPVKEFSSLNDYANVDLGRKVDAIDDPFYFLDPDALDNKLRNSIAHYKYDYQESTQLITYFSGKEGMERTKAYQLSFMSFMRKTLLLFREVHGINHLMKALLFHCILILKKEILS